MKVSLKWMQDLSGSNDLPINQADLVMKIGAQIGAIEDIKDLKPIYEAAVIVKVVECKALEGSDHLHVCLIDDQGTVKQVKRLEDNLIQVVCGAPNVATGQTVVWLPPGSVVPSSVGKDPFILTERPIMGVVSNGMLASGQELAINDDHSGIVVLEDDVEIGSYLVDYLNLDDTVIDIENKMFTHRPDLFGQLGVAREINGIYGKKFISPSWYGQEVELEPEIRVQLNVDNKLKSSGCPRFMAVSIGNIKVGPSPLWLQSYLARTGIRPINSIVDITNYVMMVTGQPMHAYDLNKIAQDGKANIIVRHPKEDEELNLLDGSSVELLKDDIVIANHDSVIGLGGIMGGKNSQVDEETTDILLECANFDMYTIRRSSFAHGVFSEAVTRFTKGQSPRQCPSVLSYAVTLIKEICPEAIVISKVADEGVELGEIKEVSVSLTLLTKYLGLELAEDEVVDLLNNVEIKSHVHNDHLIVEPPFWRSDITAAEDIIEEVARLRGFDSLPIELPLRRISPSLVPESVSLKDKLRSILVAGGVNELLTYSFVDEQLMKQTGQDIERSFKIANALSPELRYYRTSIVPSLLRKVHANHKAGFDRFGIFEIGKVHFNDLFDGEGMPDEPERLGLVVSAEAKAAKEFYQGPAYYQARYYLDYLLSSLNIDATELYFEELSNLSDDPKWGKNISMYQTGRSAIVSIGQHRLGVIGEFSQGLQRSLKLPQFCAGFEIDLEALLSLASKAAASYKQLSKYPKVMQDLTISIDQSMTFQEIHTELRNKLSGITSNDMNVNLKLIDIYQSEGSSQKNWTFRLEVDSYERTLTDLEVNKLVGELKLD